MPEPDLSATPEPAPTDTPLALPTEAPLPTEAKPTAAANLAPPPTAVSTPQLVVPVTVNLSQITPEPVGSVEPVELPNPGNPNPKATIANRDDAGPFARAWAPMSASPCCRWTRWSGRTAASAAPRPTR